MSGRKYLIDLDLNGNKLIDAVINPLAVAPAIIGAGGMYYDTASGTLAVSDGTNWVSQIRTVSGTGPVTVDNSVAGVAGISVAEADGSNAGLLTAAGFTLLSGATDAATASTLAQRDVNGNITVATPSAANHAATKAYVDQLNASGMHIVGSIDTSTNPDYPAASSGAAYKVSVGGLIGGASGEAVSPGDVILAVASSAGGDHATVGNDWLVLQSNIETATEVVAGYVRLATAAEVASPSGVTDAVPTLDQASSLVTAAVQPLSSSIGSLSSSVSSLGSQVSSLSGQVSSMNSSVLSNTTSLNSLTTAWFGKSHVETLALGQSSYTVSHNLGGVVMVEVYEAVSGESVVTGITRTSDNALTIDTSVATGVDLVVYVEKSTQNL